MGILNRANTKQDRSQPDFSNVTSKGGLTCAVDVC